jgi:glycerol-3-phosphate dehydrogenase
MWEKNWRAKTLDELDKRHDIWDIIIIGGGITGAGILRESTRLGLKALLFEQRDFAWGTSSRSSKMVHGGLRYLKEGHFSLTRHSVHERQHLLDEGPGLIDPLGFLLTVYKGDFPGRWTFTMGLTVYDMLAMHWEHKYYSPEDFQMLAPHISPRGLQGGFRYGDAQTDDARLVLRIIQEAVAAGGTAMNYVHAENLILEEDAQKVRRVTGVQVQDIETGKRLDVRGLVVINATGAWADQLRRQVGGAGRIRPLRGSHLLFPLWRLPVAQAVSFLHPVDRRPVFIFPWEGITLVGTTDMDCEIPRQDDPAISPEETAYLMAAVEAQFPSLNITLEDVVSTYAGVRPVISSGKANPSDETRDHVVWQENGLLTVTGGKLTTFRLIGLDVLKAVRQQLPDMPSPDSRMAVLDRVDVDELEAVLPDDSPLDREARRRLVGRYGVEAVKLVKAASSDELESIPGTRLLWAELRWAARAEGVVHLDDLLLRRVRLGLLLPQGGAGLLPAIRGICQPELGWDDGRWEAEQAAYLDLWRRCYSLPLEESIPDWKAMLDRARAERAALKPLKREKLVKRTMIASVLISLAGIILVFIWKRYRRKAK